MNEAERAIITQTGGRRSVLICEIIKLRRQKQKLYELLMRSEAWFETHNQYSVRRAKDTWTQERIDEELRHITGRTD